MSIYEYDEKKHVQMEREEEREKTLLELIKDGMITVEYAAEKLAISVEELKKKLEGEK